MQLIDKNTIGIEICNRDLYKGTAVKGVLFDMDGVILDTEKLYTRFWQEAAQALGYPMTQEMALGMRSLSREVGERQLKSYLGEDVDYQQVRNKRIEMMSAFIKENRVELKPGIHELLAFLKEKGIKTSVATSSPLDRTKEYLSMVGLVDAFDELVSGHMVEHGKPAPDIYIYAASKLELKPEECLVLEDSPTGLLAAYRAECIPVMVPDQDQPDVEVKNRVYAVADTLVDVISLLLDKKRF
ncbi:MAG: HAD family phosphatase [Agathobacter sp.]|nr:HAD family phosphatase [Agathobacter sp.]